jgi:hypothetical protein
MNQNLSERVRAKRTRRILRWTALLGLGACFGSAHGSGHHLRRWVRRLRPDDAADLRLRRQQRLVALRSPTARQPDCTDSIAWRAHLQCRTCTTRMGRRHERDSMSVDRLGFVWALYSSGEIFRIDPATLACVNTGYAPAQTANWKLFNMAFAGPVTANEQSLYVSGGSVDIASVGNLGKIDPVALTVQTIGVLGGAADFSVPLAGVGTVELFGLYPAISATTYLRQIDRTTGAVVGTPLAVPGFTGTPTAWAFAHWGGKFWVFVTSDHGSGPISSLYSVDRLTGSQQNELTNLAFTPTSAGSSTCVPTTVN